MSTTTSITPEYHQHEEFQNRSKKLQEIQQLGIDPYPPKFTPSHSTKELHDTYDDQAVGNSEDAAEGTTPFVTISGRLVLFRAMGKNAFGQVQDTVGRLQVMFNRDLTEVTGYNPENVDLPQPPKPLKVIEKKIDLGDIIGVSGHLFKTQKGELTLFVKTFTLLCKTLLPLPDKHSGLSDKELRYRKRWLDLISSPQVCQTFRQRSRILRIIRQTFEEKDFLQVETPILQSLYGGAEARPFVTELHALDQQMFMRISLEISLKKLIVGGLDRVFEIGKVFRNEGIDRTHNPEFTMIEAYAANWDYNDMMSLMENLVEKLALDLHNTTVISFKLPHQEDPVEIDLKAPWKRLTLKDSLKEYAQLDVDPLDDNALRKKLLASEAYSEEQIKSLPRGLLIAKLFEEYAEPHLIQPHHIIDHPIETTPLCKPHRNLKMREEGIVERFESFILGGEICNAYTELNDPVLQRQLLEEQALKKQAGDEEANPLDEEFIEAICQGMPPTAGIGIGIDRLVMLLTNNSSIRDVLYFPWMKPQT